MDWTLAGMQSHWATVLTECLKGTQGYTTFHNDRDMESPEYTHEVLANTIPMEGTLGRYTDELGQQY